jgi:hypothetical protein
MLPDFFKKDSFFTGLVIGIILPALFYGVLYGIDIIAFNTLNSHIVDKPEYLFLLSIIANLFPIKYYFVNKKNDKTGRGILLVTFVLGMLYFPLFA